MRHFTREDATAGSWQAFRNSLRVEEVRQYLDPIEHPWPRTREIAARVHGVHLAALDSGKRRPVRITDERASLLDRAFDMCAARRDDHDLRRLTQDVLSLDADGVAALPAESVEAARELDHLRHPVATAEDGVDPLEKEHTSPRRGAQLSRQAREPLVIVGNESSRNIETACYLRDIA